MADPLLDPLGAIKDLPYTPDAAADPLGAVKDLPFGKLIPSDQPGVVGLSPSAHIAQRFKQERTWEEVAPELKAAGEDPERYRQHYQLAEAQAVQPGEGVNPIEAFARSSLPFGDFLGVKGTKDYAAAQERYKAGKATKEDAYTIARYERLEQIDADRNKTLGGQLVSGLASVPKLAGEALGAGKLLGLAGKAVGIGGAVGGAAPSLARQAAGYVGQRAAMTPLMPSLYLEEARQRNLAAGREPDDIRGFPTPVAMGFLNNLVLGSLQSKIGATGPGGFIGRSLVKGGVGALESADVEAGAGLVDHFLPDDLKTHSKGGPFRDLVDGKFGAAARSATVTALTFSVFAGLHDGKPAAEKVRSAFSDLLDAYKTKGVPEEVAGKYADVLLGRLKKAMGQNPDLTPEEAKGLFQGVQLADVRARLNDIVDATVRPKPVATPENTPDLRGPQQGAEPAKPAEVPIPKTETPAPPADPQAALEEITKRQDASDARVADAERAERSARERATVMNPAADAVQVHAKADRELRAARGERKGIQKELDAARDVVMRMPLPPTVAAAEQLNDHNNKEVSNDIREAVQSGHTAAEVAESVRRGEAAGAAEGPSGGPGEAGRGAEVAPPVRGPAGEPVPGGDAAPRLGPAGEAVEGSPRGRAGAAGGDAAAAGLTARLQEAVRRVQAGDIYAVSHADMAEVRKQIDAMPLLERNAIAEAVIGRRVKRNEQAGVLIEREVLGTRRMAEGGADQWQHLHDPSTFDVLGRGASPVQVAASPPMNANGLAGAPQAPVVQPPVPVLRQIMESLRLPWVGLSAEGMVKRLQNHRVGRQLLAEEQGTAASPRVKTVDPEVVAHENAKAELTAQILVARRLGKTGEADRLDAELRDLEDRHSERVSAEGNPTAKLSKREEHVLVERAPGPDGTVKTLEQIGQEWPFGRKISRERVRQIEANALTKRGQKGSVAAKEKEKAALAELELIEKGGRTELDKEGQPKDVQVGQKLKDVLDRIDERIATHEKLLQSKERILKVLKRLQAQHKQESRRGPISAERQARFDSTEALLSGSLAKLDRPAGQGNRGTPPGDRPPSSVPAETSLGLRRGGRGAPRLPTPEPAGRPPEQAAPAGAVPETRPPGLSHADWIAQQQQARADREAAADRVKAEQKLAARKKSDANLKQNREAKTLATHPTRGGGISEESARAINMDVEGILQSKAKSIFYDSKGRRSRRHADDAIIELRANGDLPKEDLPDKHIADLLSEKLIRGDKSIESLEDGAGQAEYARREDEHYRELQRLADIDAAEAKAELDAEREDIRAAESMSQGEHDAAVDAFEKFLAEKIGAASPLGGHAAPAPTGTAPVHSPALAAHLRESAVRFVGSVRDWVRKLGGASAVKTRRLSEPAADAIAHAAEPQILAHELGDLRVDDVMAGDDRPLTRLIAGAVWYERRFRKMTKYHLDEARRQSNLGVAARAAKKFDEAAKHFAAANEHGQAAREVQTVVGRPPKGTDPHSYPLLNELDFRRWNADPQINAILERTEKLVTPELEKSYREAAGIAETDPIHSATQLSPGEGPRMSFVPAEEGDTRTTPITPTRGAFGNQRLYRLGATRQAKGSAAAYELDLGAVIRRNYADRVPAAARHELFRTLQAEELGAWAKPGEKPTGEGWRKIKDVRPPKGTQEAKNGQDDFYVHPEVYHEVRSVLAPDEPTMKLPFMLATTWSALVSTGEFVSHTKNLLTQLFRPGVNPLDVMRAMKGLLYGDREYKARVVELARITALREHNADVGQLSDLIPKEAGVTAYRPEGYRGLARKVDPTYYTGKFLTLLDRSVRIASDKAFDKLVAHGAENTESNRRDFINQIGNYSKKLQNSGVRMLRDSGVGPFATAATNFAVHGLRSLLGRSGLRATSNSAQFRLQAETIARLASLPVIAAVANYLLHGRMDGDDNTPLGALKLWTKNGKTSFFDLTNLTGLSRGARELGVLALAEGHRQGAKQAGATPGSAIDHAAKDVFMAATHPAVGPAVDMLSVLTSGKNFYGIREAHRLSTAEQKAGESQTQYNALAAFWKMNPLLDEFVKEPVDQHVLGIRPTPGEVKREKTASETVMGMMGPYGLKKQDKSPGKPLPPLR